MIFVARAPIIGVLDAGSDLSGHHRTTHVDDAHSRVVEVCGQPLCRDEKIRGHDGFSKGFVRNLSDPLDSMRTCQTCYPISINKGLVLRLLAIPAMRH
jgi:hypothetical protein